MHELGNTLPSLIRQPLSSVFHALAILFNNAAIIETGHRLLKRTPPVTVRASA
jgi:hypothetical protein